MMPMSTRDERARQASVSDIRQMYIGGRFVDARDGRHLDCMDPGTGRVIATVPDGGDEDVALAVASARTVFDGGAWTRLDARPRSRFLFELSLALRRTEAGIAEIEVCDNGKPLSQARWDVQEAAFLFEYYAGWTTKLAGELPPVGNGALSMVLGEPVGVAGLIAPSNLPLLMAAQKVAPALAAGCRCVLKPAEEAPLSALELARLAADIDVPSGALNVVTGRGPRAGAALVASRGVDKISFTDMLEVGRLIRRQPADTMQRVTFELEGKSASIVFADADLEPTIDGVCKAVFLNQGQVCGSCGRVFIEDEIYDEAVEAISRRVAALIPGHGLNPGTIFGPLISAEQHDGVVSYVDSGRAQGAIVAAEGSLPRDPELSRGLFSRPTVFVDVTSKMRVAREEIFGPVMTVMGFGDLDNGVRHANDTEYGLAGSIWTKDVTKPIAVARRLRTGTVWVNDALQAPSETMGVASRVPVWVASSDDSASRSTSSTSRSTSSSRRQKGWGHDERRGTGAGASGARNPHKDNGSGDARRGAPVGGRRA